MPSVYVYPEEFDCIEILTRKLEEIAAHPDVELTAVIPTAWDGQRYEPGFLRGYRTLVQPIRFDTMATNVEGVWAIGDIANTYQLKHLANAEAKVAFWNIAHRDDQHHPGPGSGGHVHRWRVTPR